MYGSHQRNNSNQYGNPQGNYPNNHGYSSGANQNYGYARGNQHQSSYGQGNQRTSALNNPYVPYRGSQNVPANPTYNNYNTGVQNFQGGLNNNDQQGYYSHPNDKQYQGEGLYENSRTGFIHKVYTLVSIQLVVTALISFWAMHSDVFGKIFGNVPAIIIVSVLLIVVSIAIGCFPEVTRKYGLPIIIIFTILQAILVGIICSMTKSNIVLAAAGITAVLVISLTIFACVTKTDFTGCGPYLFVLLVVLLVFGIVLIFWQNAIAHLIYACLACLLFCVYLIFDTQLILGKFENAYTLDDAYMAAIQLYMDVIQIFLQLIQILSFAD